MSLIASLGQALADLEASGLLRTPLQIEGPQGPEFQLDGRSVVCLSSNNYLGFANHPALIEAAHRALERDGLGAGGSRLISGTMRAHIEVEHRLAAFLDLPAALLFSTGYAANVGALSALAESPDVIFSDALNHASIIDGCRLSRAPVHVYRHCDLGHLESLLARHRSSARRAFVVTETLFSMDGDRAPVDGLRDLCDTYDASLLVDEAHALGILGPSGRGLCAEVGIRPDLIVGTLGKAFGVAGAFVSGELPTIRFLQNTARSFIFSTAPLPVLAAAVMCAIDLVEKADSLRHRLHRHAARLRSGLRELGYTVPPGNSPIIPVVLGDPPQTMRFSADLLERGVFAQGIRPPTVPVGTSRLRIVPMATHEDRHLDRVLEAFATLAPNLEGRNA